METKTGYLQMKNTNPVEPGVIILTMSLNAISATAIVGNNPFLVRLCAAVVFIISGIGAAQLYWVLVAQRLGEYYPNFSSIRERSNLYAVIWAFKLWLKLIVKTVTFKVTQRHEVVSGYLNVLAAFSIYLVLVVALFFKLLIMSVFSILFS